MTAHPPDSLRHLTRPLYTQLAAFALASVGVGLLLGAVSWGLAAACGFLTAIAYYIMLGVQVRRTLAKGEQPHVLVLIISMLGRQVICFLSPTLCFFYLGQAWWACILTLLLARHWVMVVSMLQAGKPTRPSQA